MSQSTQSNERTPRISSPYQPRLSVMIGLALILVLGAFIMLRSSSSASSVTSMTTSPTTAQSSSGTVTTAVVTKAKISVQVANGTSVSGLARTYTQQLMTLGWDTLPEMNGPKVNATIVYYNPGFEAAATEIAQTINVPASSVTPLNGQQPVAGSSSDDVVLILGPDAAIKG
jgi:LytR cell envelope-related transcriptional attenuator